jgi:hypothetical protein
MKLWCYIEGERDVFRLSISPGDAIDNLKKKIYDEQAKFIFECGSARLILKKVHYIMISM